MKGNKKKYSIKLLVHQIMIKLKQKKFKKKRKDAKNKNIFFNYWKYYLIISLIVIYIIINNSKGEVIKEVIKEEKEMQNKNVRVCLCSPGKKENKYIKEFVEHYKKYGVDKIYLYDNNDIDGEHFEDIINNYVKSGFVEIVNFRGKIRALYPMMNDCYRNNYMKYDWLIFFEIDEYIHLKNKDVKTYLSDKCFNNCDIINLNWILHTDNNLIYYENKPLKERFPEVEKKKNKLKSVKSILRGGIPNIKINCVHRLTGGLRNCDGFGRKSKAHGISTNNIDYTNYYIDHYASKSTEEFANKMNKGDVLHMKDNIFDRINAYFVYNEVTKEKIDYFDKCIPGFNTSNVRNNLISRIKS